jgi:hypothetical protein
VSCVVEQDATGTSDLRFVSHTATAARVLREMRPPNPGPTAITWPVNKSNFYLKLCEARPGVSKDTVRSGAVAALAKLRESGCIEWDEESPAITVTLRILSAQLDEQAAEKRGAKRKS